jgi:hypothetical protein
MRRVFQYGNFVLLLLLLVLMGCVPTQKATQPPTRLAEVNRALDGAVADIEWRSGEESDRLPFVRVTPDSVTYRRSAVSGDLAWWRAPRSQEEQLRARPIEAVKRIEKHVNGGGGWEGFWVGATPGLILSGSGVYSAATQDCSNGSPGCGLGAAIAIPAGLVLAVGGGLLLALIGNLIDDDRQVVCQAPVDRYRSQ